MPPRRNKYAAAAAEAAAAAAAGGDDEHNGTGDSGDEDAAPSRRTSKRARISTYKSAARGKASSDDDDDDSGSGGDAAAAAYEPTSDGSEITFELRKLNTHLVCSLCRGYLRDAHSIMECLHTFCKVCLYKYYQSRTNPDADSDCPKCHIPLSSTDPMRNRVRSDRVLQNLVDKILPDFAAKDELLRRELTGHKPAAPVAAPEKVEEAKPSGPSNNPYSPLPATSSSNERLSPLMLPSAAPANPPAAALGAPAAASSSGAAAAAGAGAGAGAAAIPELALELAPNTKEDTPLPALAHAFVKTSVKSTVRHLRRFVSKQLKLQVEVELMLAAEVLGVDHTLEFIKKTRWHHSVVSHGARHLLFTYRMPKGMAVKL